jgi:hypothetical protein
MSSKIRNPNIEIRNKPKPVKPEFKMGTGLFKISYILIIAIGFEFRISCFEFVCRFI